MSFQAPSQLVESIVSDIYGQNFRDMPQSYISESAANDAKRYSNTIANRLAYFENNSFVYDHMRKGSEIQIVGGEHKTLTRFTLDTCVEIGIQKDDRIPSNKIFEIIAEQMDSEKLYVGDKAQAVLMNGSPDMATLIGRSVFYGIQLDDDEGWIVRSAAQAQEKQSRWKRGPVDVSFLPNRLVVGRSYSDGPDRVVRMTEAAVLRPDKIDSSSSRVSFDAPNKSLPKWLKG